MVTSAAATTSLIENKINGWRRFVIHGDHDATRSCITRCAAPATAKTAAVVAFVLVAAATAREREKRKRKKNSNWNEGEIERERWDKHR